MQIQRMIDESMGVCEQDKTGVLSKNFADGTKNAESRKTMKITGPLSASIRQATKSLNLEIDANQSFLHGSMDSEESSRRIVKVSDERANNDKLIYATIDSLALKRARLPLQLLPIDENSDSIEKREKNNEKRVVASNRKSSSPRRPSFKVRPGVALTPQWKSRARSNPRSQPEPEKLENISNEIVKRLIIFENIINQDCEIVEASSTLTADQKVPELPELPGTSQLINDEHSNVNQSRPLRDFVESKEEENPINSLENKNSEDSCTRQKQTQQFPIEKDVNANKELTSESIISRPEVDISSIEKLPKTVTSNENLRIKTKRYKPEFTFAKNVLNYVPISGRAKRGKKSKTTNNNNSKNRQKNVRDSSDEMSNVNRGKMKPISRKELRYASISLPTNFVHLSSATTSKLLPNGDMILQSCTNNISHGKLEYHVDYQEFEIVKESSRIRRKIEKKSKDDETVYVKIQQPALKSPEMRRSRGNEKSFEASYSSFGDNERENKVENRAKVESLENSQGVPEVVKISENEDNERLHVKEAHTIAPVYEAMSEFSINRRPSSSNVAGATNTSFLWGTRRAARNNIEKEFLATAVTDEKIVISKGDNSIDANGYDAYDDVGLSRLDTEEDHYDDVGLPVTIIKSSSTDTLFEEINVDDNSELYDDVLPSPFTTKVSKIISSMTDKNDCTFDKSAAINNSLNSLHEESFEIIYSCDKNDVSSSKSVELLENDENQYLSIGNDYSSVEEGLDELKDETREDCLYDDVELPSHQDRVNSLYAGSSSGSQLGSLYNGKESEWEDLEEAAPALPLPKKNNVALRNADLQASPSKKKIVQRWSRKVRRQKSKASRKNPASRSTSRSAVRGTSTFSVAVSLGTGSVLLVGSPTTDNSDNHGIIEPSNNPRDYNSTTTYNSASRNMDVHLSSSAGNNGQLQTRGLVQLRILGRHENSIDTQETSCYVLEDTTSDDSNYETLFSSFPSDEFSSSSDDDESIANSSMQNGVAPFESRLNGIASQEAPSKPIPPPPRESSLTETFGKRMKMLRRTWSITKGSLGRMRRRTSTTNVDNDTSNIDYGGNKYTNCEQQNGASNDGRKYFSFKKHFRKSISGLSTFYLDNESNVDERLSSNNNRSKEEIYSNSSSSNCNWYTNTDYWQTNVDDQSRRNYVDHYSMLDEEPLYQFYAATTARVAFESDSEGYEEVEDPMPSSSTVDLAKPGHRTLWCQTPQVVDSKLLQRLSPDEKKVQEAKFEILTSEASYLNSLRVLVDEFLNNHDLVYEVLTPSEREKLFGGVPSVLIASERLLAELETVWREDVMLQGLPEILLDYAQRSSSVYVAYCSNQVSIDTTLKELRSRKGSKFFETITRIESHPACQSLSLHSFLMLPMQRVTRLPLLADAILSKLSMDNKEDRTRWECVLTQLSQVVMECNEGARAAGRLAEMEALERKLEYSSKVPPIVLRNRYLIRRGPVVQMLAKSDVDYKLTFGKKYHKTSLYLLLLTDYLLIAKPKSNANEETFTVIDSCKRSLVALEKVTEDSPFAGRNAMVLTLLENYSGRHVEYILTCTNATERERWLDAVSPPKPSLVGETLYETWDCPQVMALYPYAASQPDELTLQPGDVINVLRKMTDGWHLGEKLLGGEQGWFPGNYAKEVVSEHVRARNLRQRHRILARSASFLQRAKQMSRLN